MCCSLSSLHQTPYCVYYWTFNPGIPFSERSFHFSSCLLVSNKRLSATVLWIANEMWVQINYGCMLIRDQRQKRQMRSSRLSPMGLCRILVIIFSYVFSVLVLHTAHWENFQLSPRDSPAGQFTIRKIFLVLSLSVSFLTSAPFSLFSPGKCHT